MSTSTLDLILFGGESDDTDAPDHDGLTAAVREAIAEAAGTGVRAALWIGSLADRQADEANQGALQRYARAVERILSREIVTGRDGLLDDELLYELDPAHFLLERTDASGSFDLQPAERVALAALGAATAYAPSTVAGDLTAELPRLCILIDQAMALGGAPGLEA